MDGSTFDGIARMLGRVASRREGLRAASAAAAAFIAGGAVAAAGPEGERCLQVGQRCGKKSGKNGGPCKRCCSRYWTKGDKRKRCTCKPDGMRCNNSSQCCNAVCDPATKTCGTGASAVATGDPCSVAAGDVCADPAASCVAYIESPGQDLPTFCLLPFQAACTADGQCVTDTCAPLDDGGAAGADGCCGTEGIACNGNADCCYGYGCLAGSFTCISLS